MNRCFLCIFGVLASVWSYSQDHLSIQLQPLIYGDSTRMDTIAHDKCAMYWSHVRVHRQGQWQEVAGIFLFQWQQNQWVCDTPWLNEQIDSIAFQIGVDSTINVSGVMDGSLDPTHNMYWTWQSGYIDLKWEGRHANKDVIWHFGGYRQATSYKPRAILPVHAGQVAIDLSAIAQWALETNQFHLMSPKKEARIALQKLEDSWRSIP